LSSISKTVRRSKGGNASQSSWKELLPENEGVLVNCGPSRGLDGDEENILGVFMEPGGVTSSAEDRDSFVEDRDISDAERVLWPTSGSSEDFGMFIVSDMV